MSRPARLAASAVAIAATFVVFPVPLFATGEILYPTDAGVIDIKAAYGAKGDGVTDDTAALNKTHDKPFDAYRAYWLDAGTYLISDTWDVGAKAVFVEGRARDRVTIRLRDNCPGFGDPANPKAVVTFGPMTIGQGAMGQAFFNSIRHLTVDIGRGNPGAVALNFMCNNVGSVLDVELVSSDPNGRGRAGLALVNNWPGPGMIRDVRIRGFDIGIWSRIGQYSMTFEGITLEGQRECAVVNDGGQILNFRRLRSVNSVPVVRTTRRSSVITMLDSELVGRGGAAELVALENRDIIGEWARPDLFAPGLFLRNVTAEGYRIVVRSIGTTDYTAGELPRPGPGFGLLGKGTPKETVLTSGRVAEFCAHDVRTLFNVPQRSLGLPVEDTPVVPVDPLADRVNPMAFGAVGDGKTDDAVAIQRALDSGKPTVYFPAGRRFAVGSTLVVRGAVRRVDFNGAELYPIKPILDKPEPIIRIADGSAPVVVIERQGFCFLKAAFHWFDMATTRTVVIRDGAAGFGHAFRNSVKGGKLFLENVSYPGWDFDGLKVWARQLNPEGYELSLPDKTAVWNVRNRGGDLWLLGFKTEGPKTVLETVRGRTEIFGAYLYPSEGKTEGPAYVVTDGSLTVVNSANQHGWYNPQVRETRAGKVRDLAIGDCPGLHPSRDFAVLLPMFVAGPPADPTSNRADTLTPLRPEPPGKPMRSR